jgi:hypothetical protein
LLSVRFSGRVQLVHRALGEFGQRRIQDQGNAIQFFRSTPPGRFQLSKEAINNVLKSRSLVETFLEDNHSVYGVTTGIGNFATVDIPVEKLE